MCGHHRTAGRTGVAGGAGVRVMGYFPELDQLTESIRWVDQWVAKDHDALMIESMGHDSI